MIPAIKQYRKRIARRLRCCKDTKERLLTSFDNNMLAPLLEVSAEPSKEELHTAFGTPEAAAALLMEQVGEEEAASYRSRQRTIKIAAGVILAVLLAFAAYVFFEKEYSNIVHVNSGPIEGSSYVTD